MQSHFKALSLASLLFLASTTIQAQQKVSEEQVKESIKEILKEKWRPAKELQNLPKFKTTATDQRVSTNVNSIQEAEISMAVHPLDTNKIVLSFMEQSSQGLRFPIYYSSNGGQSWTKSNFNSQNILSQDFPGQLAAGGGDPVFAWDKNGRVYFSWIYLSLNPTSLDTGWFVLNYAYSDNDGQTWTVPPGTDHFIGTGALDLLSQSVFNIGDGVCDRQWMSVDNSNGPRQGTLYCSFMLMPADQTQFNLFGTAVKAKAPNSNTFGPATMAFSGQTQFANVETDNNGVVHVSFADLLTDQIKHASSSDGAQTFSADHLVGNGFNLFGAGGFIHDRENSATNMAVDGNNNLHVVYSSFPGGAVKSFYVNSTNGGNTWNTPVDLGSLFNGQNPLMPVVAASGTGVSISLSVIDNNDSARYFQVHTNDNGQTFSTPVQLSSSATYYPQYTNGEFFGDYNRSLRANCMVYTSWADGRNSIGPKVYFARTNGCNPGQNPNNVREMVTVNGNLQLESVFPNPATDKFTLKLSAAEKDKLTITLADINGRTIHRQETSVAVGNQDIGVSFGRLSAGIYNLTLRSDKGSVITRQVVIN